MRFQVVRGPRKRHKSGQIVVILRKAELGWPTTAKTRQPMLDKIRAAVEEATWKSTIAPSSGGA